MADEDDDKAGRGRGRGRQPPVPVPLPDLPERDKEAAIVALDRLADQLGGALSPRDVVDEASKDTSPLHPYFEWDEEKAADHWRLEQARRLLRVRITYAPLPQNVRMAIPLYSSAWPKRGAGQRSYQRTVLMLTEEQQADRLALDALKRAQAQLKSLPHQALHDALAGLEQIRAELETRLYGEPSDAAAQ